MKYSQWAGIVAAAVLVISCMFHWTWYPDIQQFFTGFYSFNNQYGKPGIPFLVLSVIAAIFYLLPRIWAKRWNLLVCCLIVSYGIRTFIIFTGCYRGICPEKQPAIWIMIATSCLMMICALLPDLKLRERTE